MTRSQVRFLLGTPMVIDSFDADRWDYVYSLRRGHSREVTRRHLVVWFDGDKVARSRGADPAAAAGVIHRQLSRSLIERPWRASRRRRSRGSSASGRNTSTRSPASEHPGRRGTSRPKIPTPQAAGVERGMHARRFRSARGPRPPCSPTGTSSARTDWRSASAQATTIAMRSAPTEHLPCAARKGVDEVIADALERGAERERADHAVGREPHVEVGARARVPPIGVKSQRPSRWSNGPSTRLMVMARAGSSRFLVVKLARARPLESPSLTVTSWSSPREDPAHPCTRAGTRDSVRRRPPARRPAARHKAGARCAGRHAWIYRLTRGLSQGPGAWTTAACR